MRQGISKYNNRRGVTKTSLHLFRHTFAKKWILNNGNMFSLQKMLGHSTLEMVREYVEIFGEDLRHDYDNFNSLDQFVKTGHCEVVVLLQRI